MTSVRLRVVLALALAAQPAWASSLFRQRIITKVGKDTVFIRGNDHYNKGREGEAETRTAKECVFVLDNRVMARELVLVPGRHCFAIGDSGGAVMIAAVSEPADLTIGEVVCMTGNKLALKVSIGSFSEPLEVLIHADAQFSEGGRDAVLATGKTVRIAAARKQTILAYSDKAFDGALTPKTCQASSGVLKTLAASTVLMVAEGDKAVGWQTAVRKFFVVRDGRAGKDPLPLDPKIVPHGTEVAAVLWAKRGGTPNLILAFVSPHQGRVCGTVRSFDGKGTLTLGVLGLDGLKDVDIKLEPGLAVQLDGKDTPPSEALEPGTQVSVFSARKQTVGLTSAAATEN